MPSYGTSTSRLRKHADYQRLYNVEPQAVFEADELLLLRSLGGPVPLVTVSGPRESFRFGYNKLHASDSLSRQRSRGGRKSLKSYAAEAYIGGGAIRVLEVRAATR